MAPRVGARDNYRDSDSDAAIPNRSDMSHTPFVFLVLLRGDDDRDTRGVPTDALLVRLRAGGSSDLLTTIKSGQLV